MISYRKIEEALNECLSTGEQFATYGYVPGPGDNMVTFYQEISKTFKPGSVSYYPKVYYSKKGYFELKSPSEGVVVGLAGVKYMIRNYQYSHDVKVIPGTEPIQALFDPGDLPR